MTLVPRERVQQQTAEPLLREETIKGVRLITRERVQHGMAEQIVDVRQFREEIVDTERLAPRERVQQ